MATRYLIVVPAYNEERSLTDCIKGLISTLPEADVLVVDDGSTDGTPGICRELSRCHPRVRYLRHTLNSGIGTAVQSGLLYAGQYEYAAAAQFDGDGQHDPAFLNDLLKPAADGDVDLLIGSRFLEAEKGAFRSTCFRRIGIRFFSVLISVLCRAKVTDPTSGFRAFSRRAVQLFCDTYPEDYPEPEAILLAVRHGLTIAEQPVRMRARSGGVSSIRRVASAYYMIKVTAALLIDRLRRREVLENDS